MIDLEYDLNERVGMKMQCMPLHMAKIEARKEVTKEYVEKGHYERAVEQECSKVLNDTRDN